MSEIKKEINPNADGSYTITDSHSTADIVRWLLTQDSKETIMYLLGEKSAQRTWLGLTDEERNKLWRYVVKWGDPSHDDVDLMKAIEAKLKEKNT